MSQFVGGGSVWWGEATDEPRIAAWSPRGFTPARARPTATTRLTHYQFVRNNAKQTGPISIARCLAKGDHAAHFAKCAEGDLSHEQAVIAVPHRGATLEIVRSSIQSSLPRRRSRLPPVPWLESHSYHQKVAPRPLCAMRPRTSRSIRKTILQSDCPMAGPDAGGRSGRRTVPWCRCRDDGTSWPAHLEAFLDSRPARRLCRPMNRSRARLACRRPPPPR